MRGAGTIAQTRISGGGELDEKNENPMLITEGHEKEETRGTSHGQKSGT